MGTTCVVVVDVKSNHMVQGMMVRFGHVIDVVVFTRCLVGCGPYGDGGGGENESGLSVLRVTNQKDFDLRLRGETS